MVRFGHVELPDPAVKTVKGDEIECEFRSLTSKQKDDLAAFFKDDARGMLETWGYEDSAGVNVARFNEAALVCVQMQPNAWDCSLALIIV